MIQRHILDRLAQESRDLPHLVFVDPDKSRRPAAAIAALGACEAEPIFVPWRIGHASIISGTNGQLVERGMSSGTGTAEAPECIGGIVLCGGKSTRMGQPKFALPCGHERMLDRVVRLLSEAVWPVVVVAAGDQDVGDLAPGVALARDEGPSQGPLTGIAAGMAALQGRARAAYVSSCDVPLLRPAFVRAMVAALADYDLVMPRDGTYHHPLAAVYRLSLEPAVRRLIAAQRLRPIYLLEVARAREIDVQLLRSSDPDLGSLRNANTPEEYRAALAALGFVAPGG
jgi:molybdopterin-guanine dinucleotide biosynthesis protein A